MAGVRSKPKRNDATYCRLKKWTVGTVLSIELDTIHTLGRYRKNPYVRRYRITAIGELGILVRQLYDDYDGREEHWQRKLINERVVAASPPLAAGRHG